MTTGRFFLLAILVVITVTSWPASTPHAQSSDPCAPPNGNPIKCENSLPGNPDSEWDVQGAGDATIQGFATDISVNRGGTIRFKVDTTARAYRLDIYRLGYYGGLGARKVATVSPSVSLPQNQPDCISDLDTGLLDCGNWAVSASWVVPSTAVSGLYVARAVRTDTGGASHIPFVVRNDASHSDVLFQTSDTTWQAYNDYGGNSLYVGSPAGRAYKVSYNRPFVTRQHVDGLGASNWIFWGEYPMIRFLESNGYDLSYISGIDAARSGSLMLNHRTYLTAGHDEYWSGAQRTNLETAVNSGVNLAAFAGNFMYWKVRFEAAIDGSNTAYRTLVCYKETLDGAKIDPSAEWTGTWRDPSFSPPSDGGKPENALAGSIFVVNRGPSDMNGTAITVPAAMGQSRLWRNTGVATNATAGQPTTLAMGTLGYEWDSDLDNGSRPAGLIQLSSTTENVPDMIVSGYGSYADFGPGTATHSLVLHRKPSGALVFSAGTIQWSWGLDAWHDGTATFADSNMQQAMVNQLADMGVQPTTLIAGLVPASASADATAPVATFTYPTAGQQVPVNAPITIIGTATDSGGGVVAGIEVSTDGGAHWRRATGRSNWSFSWTPATAGSYTLAVRATDDSANIQTAVTSATVSVQPDTQPPTIVSRTPAPSATSVSAGTTVIATFNEAMSAASMTTATFELRTVSNQLVPATVSYDATTLSAVLKPTSTLGFSTTYNVRVHGGSTGMKDFSGNALVGDSTWSFTTWAAPPCPCSLWTSSITPQVVDSGDTESYELGVQIRSDYDGFLTGLRFYKSLSNTGTHVGHLWRADGTLVATATFSGETQSGWQEAYFSSPVSIQAGQIYVASYYAPNGHYSVTPNFFATAGVDNSPLHALAGTESPNGVFNWGSSAFPSDSYQNSNYWVDAIYLGLAGDSTPPTVTNFLPLANAAQVSPSSSVSVRFSETMQSASISTANLTIRDSAGQLVPASLTYDPSSLSAALTPLTSLALGSPYTVTVKGGSTGVKDRAGLGMTANVSWSYTTGYQVGRGLWDWNVAVPQIPSESDDQAYELGVRFSASYDGYVEGIELYQGVGNTPTSVSLWNSSGQRLATAAVAPSNTSGWRFVNFQAPVAVSANTIYVASYFASTGHYASTPGYFNVAGVSAGFLNAPAAGQGGNGVYRPSTSGFPTVSYNGSNYWVDVKYVATAADGIVPGVLSRAPAPGTAAVGAGTNVSVVFNKSVVASTVVGSNFQLLSAAGQVVAASVTYDDSSHTATLNPDANLAFGATYTARVTGGSTGVRDAFGQTLSADVTWSFTTASAPSCPCSLWSLSSTPANPGGPDGDPFELGVRFTADIDGYIAGVRFYKSSANVGTHVGSLWAADGSPLAQATFTAETASGWQEVDFSTPVAVVAGQQYVASYFAPNGHYAGDFGYFSTDGVTTGPLHAFGGAEGANGVFKAGTPGFPNDTYNQANYWVDVVFLGGSVADTQAPTVTSVAPAQSSEAVPATSVIAEFSEALLPQSIAASGFQLRDASNQLVASTVSYNASARVAVLQPLQSLRSGSVYTAKLVGGSSGIKDLSGNPLAADYIWSFSTSALPACPCSFWDQLSMTPATPDSGDANAVEVGVRFTASMDGTISAIRFFKSAENVGQHVANLWTSSGTLLASVPVTSESASGWQTAVLPTPVPVQAGVTYVASYFAPNGHYGFQGGYFANSLVAGPLSAPAGANGLYKYSTGSAFPTDNYNSTNYWVDVVFQPYAVPLSIGAVTAVPSTSGTSITWSSNVPADSQVEFGATASYGQSSTLNATLTTSHAMTLSGLTQNAVYHFRVKSRDAIGRIEYSGDYVFNTDVTPPVVSAVQVAGLTGTAATISWTTNEVADSQVEYGTTVSYGSTSALNATLITSHTVALSGLLANTTYHYRVRTRDAAGNLGVSADATFNTDVIPPVVSAVAVTNITSNGGTIGWTTNEPADTQVEYGLTTSYGSTSSLQAALVSGHSVVLSSLQTNRTYHFRIRTKDARGNLTVTPDFTFATDGTAPTISAVTAVPGQTSVTITWTTDEPADTQADYGTSTSYGSSSTLQAALVTTHTVTITGLQTNRTYNYRVKSRDAAGNLRTSNNFTVATDATAPAISSVQANETANGATVTWSTNESSDSQVEYGLTTSYGSSSVLVPALVSSHSVVLSGLQANRAYHFRVKSRDTAGNLATSSDFTLNTDVTAPTISAVASVASQSGAAITWTTNESSDTQVEYGTTTSYGSTSSLQSSLVTSHSATLSGLQGNRTYHFRARSRDAAGNVAVSGDFTFATDSTAPTISNITETRVSSTSERINWTTNEASDTQIQYGTSQSNLNQSTTLVTTMTTAHNQTLTGLQTNRTYYYRVMSRDASGNLATSATGSFATN